MNKLLRVNLFILISSISRSLIEIYIPIILLNKGYDLKKVLLFFLIKYLSSSVSLLAFKKIVSIFNIKLVEITSIFLFIISNIFLYINIIDIKIVIILAIFNSFYLTFYWMIRHNYSSNIIKDKKATENTSLYNISNLIANIISSLLVIILKNNTLYLILLSTILYCISMFLILKISSKTNEKIIIKEIRKLTPIKNKLYICIDNFRYITTSLFPIYIYLYVYKSYNYIGLINFIMSLGSIICIFLLRKKMDKNKKEYHKITNIFFIILNVIKLFVFNPKSIMIIVFIEGIFKSLIDMITTRNIYVYSKNFRCIDFLYYTELLNSITRTIIMIIIYLLSFNIKHILLVLLILLIFNSFITYDDGKYGYINV